ncbi:MAG: hypothetical protein JOZ51_01110 [Chloroflexi bacterium]|nr:hypothetical protein [Chloroflexota bacterium]
MIDQIPFDVSVSYDERGHDIANRPAEMRQAIQWLSEQLTRADLEPRQRAQAYGMCGVWARVLHDFDAAHTFLQRALDLAQQLNDPRLLFVNRIRLAHVYQWQRQFDRSNALFADLLATSRDQPGLAAQLDFLYQHAGKNALDQQQYDRAEQYFTQALHLRRLKADPALIESTEQALAALQHQRQHRKLNESDSAPGS